MSAGAALNEVRRVSGRMRSASRWAGWYYLIVGVATIAFFGVIAAENGSVTLAMWGLAAFTVVTIVFMLTRRVQVNEVMGAQHPLSIAYIILMVVAFFAVDGLSDHSAAIAVIGIAPAVPCFIGAWRLLRR